MKLRTISSKRHLFLITEIFVIPMIFCLVVYNFYSIKTLNSEVAQSGVNTIELYQSQIEYDLKRLSMTISEYWANDYDHANMLHKVDELTRHLSGYEIGVKYRALLSSNRSLGSIFIISEKNNLNRYICQEGIYSIDTQDKMRDTVELWLKAPDKSCAQGWQPVQLNGEGFLVRMLGYNGGYTVLFVDLRATIQSQIKNRSKEEGFLYYATAQGETLTKLEEIDERYLRLKEVEKKYYLTGDAPRFMVVNRFSEILHVYIFYFIPYQGYFSYMDWMQTLLLLLSLLMVLLIPFCYILISKSYFRPMENLIKTMEKIGDGNMDEKAVSSYKIREFQRVNDTFNKMMVDIKNLKIESWERDLQKNRAELQYLQLQLKPHFFLNCLKHLYGMAELKRIDQMQEMIIQISSYLRYLFKDNMTLVTVEEELNHVRNYISLQKYSLEQDVECEIEMEEQLKDCIIPVLLIQPFVENSLKYGRKANQTLQLEIRIIELSMEGEKLLDIMINDNGNGFSQEVLKQLNAHKPYQYTEDNIGIANIRQRLYLIYGDRAVLNCSNTAEGAQSEIILPVAIHERQEVSVERSAAYESFNRG